MTAVVPKYVAHAATFKS